MTTMIFKNRVNWMLLQIVYWILELVWLRDELITDAGPASARGVQLYGNDHHSMTE